MLNFFTSLTFPKWFLLSVASLTTLLISIQLALIGLGIFILIDLYTGVKKYMYVNSIQFKFKRSFVFAIKSGGFRATFNKIGEYVFTIIMIALMESLVIGIQTIDLKFNTFTITELVVCVACIIEMWSIFENREEYKKRNGLKDLFKWILTIRTIIK